MSKEPEWKPLGTLYSKTAKSDDGPGVWGWVIGIVIFLVILAVA